MRIWFDGVCCRPIACRRIANTMMIRVNAVIMMTNDGSNVSAVITARICSVTLYFCVPSGCVVTVSAERSGAALRAR